MRWSILQLVEQTEQGQLFIAKNGDFDVPFAGGFRAILVKCGGVRGYRVGDSVCECSD